VLYTTFIQLVSFFLILKVLVIVELLHPVSLFAIRIFVTININASSICSFGGT